MKNKIINQSDEQTIKQSNKQTNKQTNKKTCQDCRGPPTEAIPVDKLQENSLHTAEIVHRLHLSLGCEAKK